jgi:enamine deaminase RidA (YjgF/YER057c/UK114 family)
LRKSARPFKLKLRASADPKIPTKFLSATRSFEKGSEAHHQPISTAALLKANYMYIFEKGSKDVMNRFLPRPYTASKLTCCAGFASSRSIHIEKKIKELGIELPSAPAPKANYNIVCRVPDENTLYVSGHLPIKPDGTLITGALAPEDGGLTIEEGYDASRQCGLNIIATLKNYLGDLDRIEQIIKVFGIVNSSSTFKHQHLVMDGCSDVIMQVFDKPIGYHARSAIGTNTLPLDASVEVEAIVKIKS